MQDVVIVGVGGLGRELAQWIEDINLVSPTFRVVGFVDDDSRKHGTMSHDLPILGGLSWVEANSRKAGVVIGIGNPATKRRVVERLRPHALDFPSVKHPRAIIGRYVELGEGAIISPGAILTTDIRIGAFVTLNFDLTVGHDVSIGDYTTISPGVHISGYAKLGAGVDLGAGVVVNPSVEIGSWSIIGSGAAVTTSLPRNCTAVGIPACPIKTRLEGWHLVGDHAKGDA